MTDESTPVLQPQKLVVLQDGRRVSHSVHGTRIQAEAEKTQYTRQLQESNQAALIPLVTVSELLLG